MPKKFFFDIINLKIMCIYKIMQPKTIAENKQNMYICKYPLFKLNNNIMNLIDCVYSKKHFLLMRKKFTKEK